MDNSTLKTLGTKKGNLLEQAPKCSSPLGLLLTSREGSLLEKYRFTFLAYLEIAATLIQMKKEETYVAELKDLCANHSGYANRSLLQNDSIFEAEAILFKRYRMDNTWLSACVAIDHFYINLANTAETEATQWNKLIAILRQIDSECTENHAERLCGQIWWHADAEQHHTLLVNNKLSSKRIDFYQEKLRDFLERPLLPASLEFLFNGLYDKIKILSPV